MKKLDRIDYRILEALQENGRLPITQLANVVNISVSPCWQRVKRLEKTGIIRRYIAEIDLEKIQHIQIVVAHVSLSTHSRKMYELFEQRLSDIPEVVECYEVTGQFDYQLKFIVANMERYNAILDTFLGTESGVEKYFSYIVTRVAKERRTIRICDIA